HRIFGDGAQYAVCANSLPLAEVQARVGRVPVPILWLDATGDLPGWLREHLDPKLADGAAWKLAPLRLFPDCKELALDNDCILWNAPAGMRQWLEDEDATALVAEDVRACFGQFGALCGAEP